MSVDSPVSHDSATLADVLVCPVCHARIAGTTCTSCGRVFGSVKGVPSYIPEDAKRTVTFDFTSSRSVRNDRFEAAFAYPDVAEAGELPYHLDGAHVAVIERLPRGNRVLEIGCGGGQMRAYVASLGLHYLGTDISPSERVTADLRSAGGPDLLADAHFLPFADAAFDLVYSAAVTEHLANPFLAAQEVFRVLKPGGIYLGNCSFLEPWHDDSFFHMTPLGVWELLSQAGFTAEHIWPEREYSGYRSLMHMGGRLTQRLSFIGDGIYWLYGANLSLRGLVGRGRRSIADDARVTGATAWIARKP